MPGGALAFVDKCTKWAVTGLTFAVGCHLTSEDNVLPPYFLLWALCNAVAGKVIKRVLDHRRPATSRKKTPGMPSSHANSLACLGSMAGLALWTYAGVTSPLACALPVLIAAGLTALRVVEGHHTVPQVLAGWAMGSVSAVLSFQAEARVVHVNERPREARLGLVTVALVLAAIAGAKAVRTWSWEGS